MKDFLVAYDFRKLYKKIKAKIVCHMLSKIANDLNRVNILPKRSTTYKYHEFSSFKYVYASNG